MTEYINSSLTCKTDIYRGYIRAVQKSLCKPNGVATNSPDFIIIRCGANYFVVEQTNAIRTVLCTCTSANKHTVFSNSFYTRPPARSTVRLVLVVNVRNNYWQYNSKYSKTFQANSKNKHAHNWMICLKNSTHMI